MLLRFCGDLRLIRSGKSRCSARSAGVHLCETILDGVIRVRCPHLLRSLPDQAPNSKLRYKAGVDEDNRDRRRQDDRIDQAWLSDAHPAYSHRCCDFPRFIIQLIAVPAAMPAANVIATVSNGCRSKRLFVLYRSSVAAPAPSLAARLAVKTLSSSASTTADAARVALCVELSICWPTCSKTDCSIAY